MRDSARHNDCPRKGDACAGVHDANPPRSEAALELGDGPLPDAAWTLETPYDEHAGLKDHVAFYSEKFDGLQFKID